MLIDSHCHLDFPELAADRAGILARARQNGVGLMLSICTHLSRFAPILTIAESEPDIFCTVGVHPHHADPEMPLTSVEAFVQAAAHPKVIGIGECGLDYFYQHSSREAQQKSFAMQLEACRITGLPVIIHARDADDDMIAMLREQGRGVSGILHCFSSGRALAEAAIELGYYVSFSGILTFKKSTELQEIARDLPLDRLLVETDAPFLAPVPMRGKSNEPAFVVHTAEKLAELRGITYAEVAAATTANFKRLFTKLSA